MINSDKELDEILEQLIVEVEGEATKYIESKGKLIRLPIRARVDKVLPSLNALIEKKVREARKATVQPILDIQMKLDDDYGEFEALDDIEKYLSTLQDNQAK